MAEKALKLRAENPRLKLLLLGDLPFLRSFAVSFPACSDGELAIQPIESLIRDVDEILDDQAS
jgi:hypothetical protein